MRHLSRLLQSTSPQVIFLSETRNFSISVSSLVNHFNLNDAFVVPSQGHSGGLWLMWTDEIELHIFDHSQNYILDVCKNTTSNISYGLICMYGDPRHISTSIIWNHVQYFVSQNSNLPMLCMGDLNDIMHPSEKSGPSSVDFNRMNDFCAYVNNCGLIDLGFSGPAYTWSNKRFSSMPTYERLDRCLANAEWCRVFPTSLVLHLPMMYNDHAPILLLSVSNRQRPKKPFRFENWWLMEEDFQDVAQTSWNRSASHSFSHKTRFLAADLRKWRRLKPKTRDQLQSIEEQILADQSLHPSQQNPTLQQQLHQQHQHLQNREEVYHIQRAKNVGLSKVTATQTSSTFLSLRETAKTPSPFSLTLMVPIPQLQIK
jgi:hypothetical protein